MIPISILSGSIWLHVRFRLCSPLTPTPVRSAHPSFRWYKVGSSGASMHPASIRVLCVQAKRVGNFGDGFSSDPETLLIDVVSRTQWSRPAGTP